VRTSWVYACDPLVGDELAARLAELGYAPHRPALAGPQGVAAQLADAPQPDVVVVAAAAHSLALATRIAGAVRDVEEAGSVPLLLALARDALTAAPPTLLAEELVVAPVCADELRLRIECALHRLGRGVDGDVVRIGGLELDLASYEASIEGRRIPLTHMEYELLRFLATHPNRVFSREALLERVWGYGFYGATRTVDVHVRRVRAKLGVRHAERIHTVRSVGYRFQP
jgi:DNA-binding response OmpR family regulator